MLPNTFVIFLPNTFYTANNTRMHSTTLHKNEPVGHLQQYEIEENILRISTNNADVILSVYHESVIRVQIYKEGLPHEDNPYSVIEKPSDMPVHFEEQDDKLILATAMIRVEIAKSPVRITFLDKDGHVINADDPAFGSSWIGEEATTYKVLQEGERFLGLGEKTGGLDRRGKAYTNWNYDYFAYPTDGDPLYMSVPFYIGIHHGLCYGIFFDNTYKTQFNFGASNRRFSYFQSQGPGMDYYFIHHDDMEGIIEAYTLLTGRTPLPPKWCLGYQQCRYSYYPDKEVLQVARTFREKNLPADVIYLDIHYMEDYKVFTFHPERFPNPKQLVDELESMGFHVVVIVDPGVKIEEGYDCYNSGREKDVFAKYPDGTYYEGAVWPGWCHFPDFTRAATREWWGAQYTIYTEAGIEGFWNDMNEPATWGNNIPDLVEFDFEGQGATHKKAHNVYGMQMVRSTYEGTRKLLNGKRPFILSRSGYAGIQRYAAVWTGDNVADDDHMLTGVRLINSLGLSGIPYAGYDVGGFAGDASRQLFARWIALGTFSPFYRGHSMINSRDAEPWTFGEEVEEISRNFLNLRYRLLPYLYSIFYEASQTGMPVQRSLAIYHPHDHRTFAPAYENQYCFGPNFLIAPVRGEQDMAKVFFPAGGWYDFFRDRYYDGDQEVLVEVQSDEIPCYVRAGAIVPMQDVVQHTNETPAPTLHLHVYKGNTATSFEYYDDDGATYGYEEGAFYKRQFSFHPNEQQLLLDHPEGNYSPFFHQVKVYFHGFQHLPPSIRVNDEEVAVQYETIRFVAPISNFDPWGNDSDNSKEIRDIHTITFNDQPQLMAVQW